MMIRFPKVPSTSASTHLSFPSPQDATCHPRGRWGALGGVALEVMGMARAGWSRWTSTPGGVEGEGPSRATLIWR